MKSGTVIHLGPSATVSQYLMIFKNPKCRMTNILKNKKKSYLSNGLTDFDKIWHGDNISFPDSVYSNLKIKDCRLLPYRKHKNQNISKTA